MNTLHGYCALHDCTYPLNEPDDVCPHCLSAKVQDLEWRDTEDELTTEEMDIYET
jgi:RNA polymerase subunit RPABC4/transcription elongation factor Spt4